jgi:GT2 family glycosyltransferase
MIPTPSAAPGLASVIVPCFNQLEHTRRCIAALSRHTRPPWELVVVDNGSADGTAEYLRGVRDTAPFRVEVIANPENRGFPAACNQGLAAARGEYLVLLNNDAVVTDAWLDQLAALARSGPRIGMTGPMSNYASPPQLVPEVSYADLAEMDRFAAAWRAGRRGRWLLTPKLSGFCVLIKRAALEAVGGLDERFGPGLFDDDDLALRMRRAGYELAVALDLFVHHAGSRTFVGEAIDAAALLEENRARFEAKWGPDAGAGREVELAPWDRATAAAGPPAGVGLADPRPMGEPGRPQGAGAAPEAEDAWPPDAPVPRLAPGTSREMVGQALAILAESPGSMARKAALWERLAAQVAEHGRNNGSTWGMEKLRGLDGSIIYMGRAAEFLVFDPAGRPSRGRGPGCLAGSRGGVLVPRYEGMKPA